MLTVERVVSAVRTLIRVFVMYEFTRSILAGVGRKHGATSSTIVVLDLVATVIVAHLEDSENRSWPLIVTAVALTELARIFLMAKLP